MEVSKTSYYNYVKQLKAPVTPTPAARRRERIIELITTIHHKSRGFAGIRTIKAILAQEYGLDVSLRLINKLKKHLGLITKIKRRYKTTTLAGKQASKCRDLVQRRFHPPVPTTVLVGDITLCPYR